MRVNDLPMPSVRVHDDPWLERWPVRPVIAISGLRVAIEWDDPEVIWDVDDPVQARVARVDSARVGVDYVGISDNTSRVGRARVGAAQVGRP